MTSVTCADAGFGQTIASRTLAAVVGPTAAGKSDLAVANSDSATVSVLLNNGNGTFAPKLDYRTGDAAVSVAAADLNGDGRPDLAVVNRGSNTVSILPNICVP